MAPVGAIEGSALAQLMRHSLWAYPAVEIVHITGIILLVGSVAMLDLRLLGLSKSIPVSALARHLLPWSWAALLLIVPSGLAMFAAHATDFLGNGAFALKMGLLLAAGCNAAFFHVGPYRTVKEWDVGRAAPAAARLSAAASLIIWVGVVSCGRLLAYL
jgi:hypothetical protein